MSCHGPLTQHLELHPASLQFVVTGCRHRDQWRQCAEENGASTEKHVGVYAAVRRFVFVDGNSRREAARVFGLSRETVLKMCRFSLPLGYTRTKPVEKPKLGPLLPVIDSILQADQTAPVKQQHSAKRISEGAPDNSTPFSTILGLAAPETLDHDLARTRPESTACAAVRKPLRQAATLISINQH